MNNLREKLFDFYQRIRYGRARLPYYMGRVYRERDGKTTILGGSPIRFLYAPKGDTLGFVKPIGKATSANTIEIRMSNND